MIDWRSETNLSVDNEFYDPLRYVHCICPYDLSCKQATQLFYNFLQSVRTCLSPSAYKHGPNNLTFTQNGICLSLPLLSRNLLKLHRNTCQEVSHEFGLSIDHVPV